MRDIWRGKTMYLTGDVVSISFHLSEPRKALKELSPGEEVGDYNQIESLSLLTLQHAIAI